MQSKKLIELIGQDGINNENTGSHPFIAFVPAQVPGIESKGFALQELQEYFHSHLPDGSNIRLIEGWVAEELKLTPKKSKGVKEFVVSNVALPVFVTIFSAFLTEWLINPLTRSQAAKPDVHQTGSIPNNEIEFTVTIVDTLNREKKITFKGPVDDADKIARKLLELAQEH